MSNSKQILGQLAGAQTQAHTNKTLTSHGLDDDFVASRLKTLSRAKDQKVHFAKDDKEPGFKYSKKMQDNRTQLDAVKFIATLRDMVPRGITIGTVDGAPLEHRMTWYPPEPKDIPDWERMVKAGQELDKKRKQEGVKGNGE